MTAAHIPLDLPHPWLSPDGAPYQTRRYQRKLRVLAVNDCTSNCWFCHNEGMPKRSGAVLHADILASALPVLGALTQYRAVISGGEPALSPHICELLAALEAEGYDVTLIASEAGLTSLRPLLPSITALHFSIRLRDYVGSERRAEFWSALLNVRRQSTGVRWTINTTVEELEATLAALPQITARASELGANLKLLGLFEGVSAKTRRFPARWIDRWSRVIDWFDRAGYVFQSSDGRTVRFMSGSSQYVDISEISCAAAVSHLDGGRCFDAMDVTIDPSGQLKLCRWQSNAASIASSHDVSAAVDLLRWLKRQDGRGCPLGLPMEAGESSPYEFQSTPVWPVITEAHHRAVELQLRNQAVSYFGREGTVARFENEFAAAVGSADALALASGTVAVYLACHALDLTHGAEVIVPSMTYPGVVAAILWAGARIAVCDVDRVTGNIDVDAMLQAMTGETRAVVVTHLWGVPADIERLVAVCRPRGIRIIEDASHAYGASVRGVPVGSFGDAGCFSLQANKIVFAGEGGVFVARDREVFERAAALASLGPRFHDTVRTAALSSYEGTGVGLKLKIHPIGAALALVSLREGRAVLAARAQRMNILNAEIEHVDGILQPFVALRNERAYYAYRLALTNELTDRRPRLMDALLRAGLDVRLPDWDLVPDLPLVRDSDRARTSPLPNARLLARSQFGLPTFTTEPLDLVQGYARTLREVASEVLRPSTARSGGVRGIV